MTYTEQRKRDVVKYTLVLANGQKKTGEKVIELLNTYMDDEKIPAWAYWRNQTGIFLNLIKEKLSTYLSNRPEK